MSPRPNRSALFLPALILVLSQVGCSMVATPGEVEPSPPPSPVAEARMERRLPPVPRPPWENPALDRLPQEVRALWVVRTTLTDPDSIRSMVDRAARAGFNTLIVQVRGRGDAYYWSRWEPRPESVERQGPDFDPLALVIQEAHARGLMVHAWVNTHLIGNADYPPQSPVHLFVSRPDLLAVPRPLARELFGMDPFDPRFAEALLAYAQANLDQVEGVYSAPSDPEVKEQIYSVWMDLVESYDLDGLHFDYIRYPNPEFDYSRGALERFRTWVGPRLSPARKEELEEAYQRDPLAYTDALPGPWDEFRRAQITDLVERIYYGVKKRKPEIVVSAAVFADAEDASRSRFQDWRRWVRGGFLDVVAPMAYTPDNQAFRQQIGAAVDAVEPRRVWAGIGAYQNTFQGTLDKIRIARELGVGGVSLFSYDWAVSQGESDGGRSFLDRVGDRMFRGR